MASSDFEQPVEPIENASKIERMICEYNFLQKAVTKRTRLYVGLFMNLFARKAKSFLHTDNDTLVRLEDAETFCSFHCRMRDYEQFAVEFVSRYADEIEFSFSKHVNRVWDKLEVSSIYVSTLINNYDAFLRVPQSLSRCEVLLAFCEFTTSTFGFVCSFIYSNGQHRRYFEDNMKHFLPHCTVDDLQQFSELFREFIAICRKEDSDHLLVTNEKHLTRLMDDRCYRIKWCHKRLIGTVVSKSDSTFQLLRALMQRLMYVNINKHSLRVDVSKLNHYLSVIIVSKYVEYVASNMQPTEHVDN